MTIEDCPFKKQSICQAEAPQSCELFSQCLDTVLKENGDMSLKQIQEVFPNLTTEQTAKLREKRLEKHPDNKKPILTFVENLKQLPSMYREQFTRIHLEGVLTEGQPLDLSRINGNHDGLNGSGE